MEQLRYSLPLLELKPGLRYRYTLAASTGKGYIDVYATKETDKEWEGIIGFKIEQQAEKKAKLVRFKIDKRSLDLLLSYSLGKDEILEDSVRLIEQYHDSKIGSMLQIVLAPCSPFSVTGELMRQSAKLAREYGVLLPSRK